MIIGKEYQENALLIYRGVFTVNLISILGNHIRLLPDHDPKLLQRVFRIFVEISQNVSYYSIEARKVKDGLSCGMGWVTIQDFNDCYRITTGNPIKPEHAPKLKNYCSEINALGGEELRSLKRETRSQAIVRETGAQVGLIQSSILSGNKLDYVLSDSENEGCFFILSTKINK
jgi:hypothetical protein